MNAMSTDQRKYQLKARAQRQLETRDRIVAATEALHREVGPARTTIAEVARRAGVQRLTVYNTFPKPEELFAACQQRFLSENPPPELVLPGVGDDPLRCLRTTLLRLYGWYRANQAMERNVHRDRQLIPELDALLRRTGDARLDAAAGAYAESIGPAGPGRAGVGAMVRLALDYRTWDMLAESGQSDREGARLFVEAVGCLAGR